MVFFKCAVYLLLLVAFCGVNVAKEVAEDRENGNPYVFGDEDFDTLFKTQHGKMKVLPKFTERSELFRAIDDLRMMILEVDPLTFVIPSHWDSDIFFFVAQGRGTISLALGDRRESFNIEKGHLMLIPAGYTFYMINRDDREKLILRSFIRPIGNGRHFMSFFGVGGEDPESFYYAFSPGILEAAFNTSSDRLQKFFSRQSKGVMVRASKEQIKALTAEEDAPGTDYCLKDIGPCQILSYRTSHTEFGEVFMVIPKEYAILEQLNMYISFSNTTQGCMNYPFYSTRVTKIIVVVSGRGRFEMAVPHTEEGSTRIHYKKISAELRPGMIFVVPPGHPMVQMSSQDENLETLNLEFNGKGNERWVLAGSENIMKNFQDAAKELTFGISAEEVDEVLYRQNADFYVRGPSQVGSRGIAAF